VLLFVILFYIVGCRHGGLTLLFQTHYIALIAIALGDVVIPAPEKTARVFGMRFAGKQV